MTSKKNESVLATTPTKAMSNLLEVFELQAKRISVIEQQFLNLSSRMSDFENSKPKSNRWA